MSSYALWRRALKRCDRRAIAYIATRDQREADLLSQAVRLANSLAPGPRG